MQFREDSGEGGKGFVKLKSGEFIRGVFRGEIYEFRQHWENNRSTVCTGSEAGCPLCAKGNKPGFRFRLNFITKEGDHYVAKVFEQGWTVYQQLRELNKEVPLEHAIVKISRSGEGTNTTYNFIVPPKDGQVTPELNSKLDQVELLDLSHKASKDAAGGEGDYTEDNIPF